MLPNMVKLLEPFNAVVGLPPTFPKQVCSHGLTPGRVLSVCVMLLPFLQTLAELFPPATIAVITKADAVTSGPDFVVEQVPCDVHVTMSRRPLYLHGRYLKHVRGVSQSPWIVDGVRLGAYSVEELIANPILPKFGVRHSFFSDLCG